MFGVGLGHWESRRVYYTCRDGHGDVAIDGDAFGEATNLAALILSKMPAVKYGCRASRMYEPD